MPEQRSPIGQGMDDCELCHGIGLVGKDGTACPCVRMGGTKTKPPTAPRAVSGMRVALCRTWASGEPIVVGVIGNLEGVQLDTLRKHIKAIWDAFKHGKGSVSSTDFLEFLEEHGIRVEDVAETVVLE